MYYTYLESPVGRLTLAGDDAGLRSIEFERSRWPIKRVEEWREDPSRFVEASEQLTAYFAGKLTRFDLRLAPEGTPFQRSVWRALERIPYGQTMSYGELAREIDRPTASRAVGAANGRNPLSIVVPCHRVIGSSGDLTGFGGGLAVKRALLDLERGHAPESARQRPFAWQSVEAR